MTKKHVSEAEYLEMVKEVEALRKQVEHPFYKRVDEFREEVKAEALLKASKKYPEPFSPQSWSVRELGKHAMAENYDQGNYIVGLMEKAEELEKSLVELAHASAQKIQQLEDKVYYAAGFARTLYAAEFLQEGWDQSEVIDYIREEARDVAELMEHEDIAKELLKRRRKQGKNHVADF